MVGISLGIPSPAGPLEKILASFGPSLVATEFRGDAGLIAVKPTCSREVVDRAAEYLTKHGNDGTKALEAAQVANDDEVVEVLGLVINVDRINRPNLYPPIPKGTLGFDDRD